MVPISKLTTPHIKRAAKIINFFINKSITKNKINVSYKNSMTNSNVCVTFAFEEEMYFPQNQHYETCHRYWEHKDKNWIL